MSEYVPLITRIEVSHDSGILAFVGNPVSYVQADGNDNMSSVPTGSEP